MDVLNVIISDVISAVVGPSSRLYPLYLLVAFGICFFLYRWRRISTPFFAWLLPKSIYLHPSHLIDLKIIVFTRFVAVIGLFNIVITSSSIASAVADSVSLDLGVSAFHPVVISISLLVVSDFSTYWVHRLHHQNRIIWPYHSLHHSAEVMTPLTVYRKHPVYDLISGFTRSGLIGVLQGVFLILFEQNPGFAAIAGVNLLYVVFNIAGSNLRHSHVWLSFGRVLEHVLISPAQHQIHHSLSPQHHNKNYGEVLAIWDWMFRTLYIPREMEVLEYGLADAEGNRLRQRHNSLRAALVVPIRDSYHQLIKLFAEHNNKRRVEGCNNFSEAELDKIDNKTIR